MGATLAALVIVAKDSLGNLVVLVGRSNKSLRLPSWASPLDAREEAARRGAALANEFELPTVSVVHAHTGNNYLAFAAPCLDAEPLLGVSGVDVFVEPHDLCTWCLADDSAGYAWASSEALPPGAIKTACEGALGTVRVSRPVALPSDTQFVQRLGADPPSGDVFAPRERQHHTPAKRWPLRVALHEASQALARRALVQAGGVTAE